MNNIVGIIIVALILATIFMVALFKFWQVTGTIRTPLGSGTLTAQQQAQRAAQGSAEVSQISGEEIRIDNITGAKGSTTTEGAVCVTDLTAQKRIKIGKITGLDQGPTRE